MNVLKALWIIPLLSVSLQPPPDSSETRLGISFGGGSYSMISRDCSGNAVDATEVPFIAGSVSVEHKIAKNLWIGGRIDEFKRKKIRSLDQTVVYDPATQNYSYITDLRTRGSFVSPYILVEEKSLGIGLGAIFPVKSFLLGNDQPEYLLLGSNTFEKIRPAARLRFGRLDRIHIEGSYGFNSPIIAGGGLYDFGVGIPLRQGLGRVWFGIDAVPYEASGLLLKTTIPLDEEIYLTGSGRYAKGGSITTEYAWSFGLSYRWLH